MNVFASQLRTKLESLGIDDWALGDISGMTIGGQRYARSLSLALPYNFSWTIYDEQTYHDTLSLRREQLGEKALAIHAFLSHAEVRHLFIPYAEETDPSGILRVDHKRFAAHAGLGWIGKSGLLVTKKHGPRIRLTTLFLDADLPANAPVEKSLCGNCRACVETCPFGCIRGTLWQADVEGVEFVDAKRCQEQRSFAVPKLGRNHYCGYCVLACPVGAGSLLGKLPRFPFPKP